MFTNVGVKISLKGAAATVSQPIEETNRGILSFSVILYHLLNAHRTLLYYKTNFPTVPLATQNRHTLKWQVGKPFTIYFFLCVCVFHAVHNFPLFINIAV